MRQGPQHHSFCPSIISEDSSSVSAKTTSRYPFWITISHCDKALFILESPRTAQEPSILIRQCGRPKYQYTAPCCGTDAEARSDRGNNECKNYSRTQEYYLQFPSLYSPCTTSDQVFRTSSAYCAYLSLCHFRRISTRSHDLQEPQISR